MWRNKRTMSPWIWRRYDNSYRTQPVGNSAEFVVGNQWAQWVTNPVGFVGLGAGTMLASFQQIIASPASSSWCAQTAMTSYRGITEIGPYAGSTWNPYHQPSAVRRIAVKRIVGSIDLFPVATTLSLGDVLYGHLSVHRVKTLGSPLPTTPGLASPPAATAIGPPPTGTQIQAPITTVPNVNNLWDLSSTRPLWYRRYCWYYGNFAGLTGNIMVQSTWSHVKVNIVFARPIVLDMEDGLLFQMTADLHSNAVAITGVYYLTALPYLTFLERNLG